MTKKPPLSDEDKQAFRDAVKGVTPVKHKKVNLKRTKPSARAIASKSTHEYEIETDTLPPLSAAVSAPVTGDMTLSFATNGISERVLRKLRRGHNPIEDTLDLHSMTVNEARDALQQFIQQSVQCAYRCVCVIHGKGYRSGEKFPKLKNKVNVWLQQMDEVLAFVSSQLKDGGAGAVYVLLKRYN